MKIWERLTQKYTGWFGVVVFGLMAVYALTMCTPIACLMFVDGDDARLLTDMRGPNNVVLILSIVGLLASGAFFLCRNNIRRKYYISNYVSVGLIAAFSVFASIYFLMIVRNYHVRYFGQNFDEINAMFEYLAPDSHLARTSIVFPLGYVLGILVIVYAVLCINTLVLKLPMISSKIHHENEEVNYVKAQ